MANTGKHTAWTLYLEYQRLVGEGTAGTVTPQDVAAAKAAYEAAAASEVARLSGSGPAAPPPDRPRVRSGFVELLPGT